MARHMNQALLLLSLCLLACDASTEAQEAQDTSGSAAEETGGNCDTAWYIDYDGDGAGTDGTFTQTACSAPAGYVANADDCDDEDPSLHPGADEVCDGIDQDCDGTTDEDPTDGTVWYEDADGDNYGNPAVSTMACSRPDGFSANNGDTDDNDPRVPGAYRGDWTTLGNGPSHTGYFAGSSADHAIQEGWSAAVGSGLNQVAVEGGIVAVTVGAYFGQGQVLTLNADDGSQRWTYALDEAYSVNPPTLVEGSLYFQRGNSGDDTHLWCFDGDSGSLRWRSAHYAQWERYLAPTVADGGVFVNGGYYGGMYGFDEADGDELFFVDLPQYDEWTPAWADGVLYSFVEGVFSAYEPSNGDDLWSVDIGWDWAGWSMTTAPVIADGAALLATSEGLFAVDLASHTLRWTVAGDFNGIPVTAAGVAYAITDGAVEAYDVETGEYLAIYVGDSSSDGQPIVTDDMLVIPARDSTYLYDLYSGALIEEIEAGGPVSLADGRLYIATEEGTLRTWSWGP